MHAKYCLLLTYWSMYSYISALSVCLAPCSRRLPKSLPQNSLTLNAPRSPSVYLAAPYSEVTPIVRPGFPAAGWTPPCLAVGSADIISPPPVRRLPFSPNFLFHQVIFQTVPGHTLSPLLDTTVVPRPVAPPGTSRPSTDRPCISLDHSIIRDWYFPPAGLGDNARARRKGGRESAAWLAYLYPANIYLTVRRL